MPHLARPFVLLLALPIAFLLWHMAVRQRPALRFSQLALLHRLPSGRAVRTRRGILILTGLGLFLLLLALAGPRWPDPGSRVPSEGITIALVLDASASMTQEDFVAQDTVMTRWQAVQKLARLFVLGGELQGASFSGRPNDLIALVTFAQRPETDCPPTLDHEALLALVDEEPARSVPGTNPGDAIAWALHLLSQAPTQRKVIVLISDGEDNVEGDNLNALQAAQIAKAMQVPIYAIEIQPLDQEAKKAKPARTNMQMLAEETSGLVLPAHDARELARAYKAIDEMERERILTYHYRRHYDGEPWFAGAALAVFLLLALLRSTRWRMAP